MGSHSKIDAHLDSNRASFPLAGLRIDAIEMRGAIERIEDWIREQKCGCYVAVTGMHGVAESRRNPIVHAALCSAHMVVPDGMPLVWLARRHGMSLRQRVCGADLMLEFCRQTGSRYRHFFYGGANGVAESLAHSLQEQYGITVAGSYAPPFRPLTESEEGAVRDVINDASPHLLWIGLGTPKQELWMFDHQAALRVPVMIGVGAAFDMVSGRVPRPPRWMQQSGLEWCYRLWKEPRRLWRRYLVTIPIAAASAVLDNIKQPKLP